MDVRKKVAAGFALSFVLLVGVGVVAYRSITALAKTSYAVTHTHVVLEHYRRAHLLKDAETGSAASSSRATRRTSSPTQRRRRAAQRRSTSCAR